MRRVLVLASSIIPLKGLPTNGGGLRGWTLARGLETAGFAVALLFPRNSLDEQLAPIAEPDYAAALAQTFDWANALATVREHQPDVVVATSWPLAAQLAGCPVPLVVDLAGSLLLEFLAQGDDTALARAHEKAAALAAADYVTCAGNGQRRYLQAWLLLCGFTPEDCDRRCGVVPISCDPDLPPRGAPPDEPRLIFAGMALGWQNPLPGIEATLAALERRNCGHLDLFTGFHPRYSAGADWYPRLADLVAGSRRATLHGLLPYEALLAEYAGATAALDLYSRSLERELAVNTRTVDFLRCGAPPIYGDYAELSTAIRDYDAGFVVAPDDPAAVATAVDAILDDRQLLRRKSAQAQRLARERLAWDRTIGPLAGFCATASKRQPGRLSPEAFVPTLRDQNAALARQLAERDAEIERLRAYAARLEGEWRLKNDRIAAQESELAAWRRAPWRRALAQAAAAVARRG